MTTAIGIDQRTDAQKALDERVKARVEKGIALLFEKYGPNWVDKIDPGTLDLSDGSCCVLGQVYDDQVEEENYDDGYNLGCDLLGITNSDEAYGFSREGSETWADLEEAWLDALVPLKRGSV